MQLSCKNKHSTLRMDHISKTEESKVVQNINPVQSSNASHVLSNKNQQMEIVHSQESLNHEKVLDNWERIKIRSFTYTELKSNKFDNWNQEVDEFQMNNSI